MAKKIGALPFTNKCSPNIFLAAILSHMKRLYRSRFDRKIAGICGGLANYFNIDPTLIRLIAVFILICTGIVPMFLVYLIGWIVIPEEPRN